MIEHIELTSSVEDRDVTQSKIYMVRLKIIYCKQRKCKDDYRKDMHFSGFGNGLGGDRRLLQNHLR